ncbi:hypothetical protein J1N35_032148 [Gossypium stocksii]|uniref:CCHC-type domain-containing protein n=1 Tax=Gossypium stocksii TaxID=47602 RepID=A0A9D3ZUF0_9ROSI|nr:hypothetical protein J1N35_032148 [Gossypium stocksii]
MLPTICFSCGKYGHTKELCATMQSDSGPEKQQENINVDFALTSKPTSLMPQPIEVQNADPGACDTSVGSWIHRTVLYLAKRDRNTSFFHSRTLQWRKVNRILALRISNGEWCSDESIFSDEAARFFENLYGEISTPMSELPLNIFSRLKENDIDFLNTLVFNDEIKKALFDMAPLKALGSDSFHAYFFQSQWDLVGCAVCEWVQGIFVGNRIEEDLNNTLIMLIPKKDCPEDFSHFRPISLCSVMYKSAIKVIANRFKVVFPNFISPE